MGPGGRYPPTTVDRGSTVTRGTPGLAASHEAHRRLTTRDAYVTLRKAQKPAYGAPAYSRWLNRPVGRVLAAGAYRLGMSPNQVTAVSALFTYAGIAVIALVRPTPAWSIAAAILLLVGYALDSADGQLARLTKSGRPSGEWLDHVIDMGKVCLLHGSIAVSWVRWGVPGRGWEEGWVVGIPVLFLTVSVVAFFGWLLSDLLVRISRARVASAAGAPAPHSAPGPAAAPALRSILRLPSDYGLLALTFLVYSTWVFPVTYTLLLAANSVILGAALPTWFRQVRSSEESR